MARGKFITLEGGEGSGKSTQTERLASALRASGREVVATREPGGTSGGEMIRKLLVEGRADRWHPLTEALLHNAARNEHVIKLIAPALARGAWVISDRFADSTVAYQGFAQGLDRDRIAALHRLVLGDAAPDLTIVIDVPAAVGLGRAGGRRAQMQRYEMMGADFHEHIRAAFQEIAKREPERCVIVDGAPPADRVTKEIFAVVARRFAVTLPSDG